MWCGLLRIAAVWCGASWVVVEGQFDEFRHKVERGNEFVRAAVHGCLQDIGVEFMEEQSKLFNVLRRFEAIAEGCTPSLLGKPVLVVGFSPARKIIFIESFTGVAEARNYGGVGDAVLEHKINLVAEGLREVGNFAGTATMENEMSGIMEGLDEGRHGGLD